MEELLQKRIVYTVIATICLVLAVGSILFIYFCNIDYLCFIGSVIVALIGIILYFNLIGINRELAELRAVQTFRKIFSSYIEYGCSEKEAYINTMQYCALIRIAKALDRVVIAQGIDILVNSQK